jgi:hypothetical protein
MAGVRRVVLLTLAWEDLSKSVSVHGAPEGIPLREPTPGVLLHTEVGWLLLDTGFNTALIRDPALRRRFYPEIDYIPVLPGPGEPIEEALDKVGLAYPFNRSSVMGWLVLVQECTTRRPRVSSRHGSAPMRTAWTIWSGCVGLRVSPVRTVAREVAGG